jgi:alpha-L-rhamnosidase
MSNEATELAGPRCEYRVNPLGIDVERPRLSWRLATARRGAAQRAYRVRVASDPDLLGGDAADLWDSGRVESDQSLDVPYGGPPLGSGQRAWWSATVWDERGGETSLPEPAWWEMGLLQRSDWRAEWIGAALAGGPRTGVPCPLLRRAFRIGGQIDSARLYCTALGLYELELNGRRVGDLQLAPGWTDYRRRVRYQTYDVGGLLRPGENVLGATLGDGWYCGHIGWEQRQRYGDRPRLLAQLHIRYRDGSSELVATDAAWRTSFGPLLAADLLMGESYDARLEQPGWSAPGFDDGAWAPAVCFPDPGAALVAQNGPPVLAHEELRPAGPPARPPVPYSSAWIFDLGQNMTGRVRLRVSGPRGATVTLRHAEVLKPDGTLYTDNLRSARATDHYTLRGGGEEVWEPRFTFHGFRYVELSGLSEPPGPEAVTGVVLHSAVEPTGAFGCSEPLVDQLQRNIVWGQKGNFVDLPTDCPQRDERLGWTGDAQVFLPTAAFNMDVAAFFTKWQQDLADAQDERGRVPAVAPAEGGSLPPEGGPAWADALVICPWTIYRCYGDTRLLEQHYDSMARFVGFLERTSPALIRCDPLAPREPDAWDGFGDWLATDNGRENRIGLTPRSLIGTAYFARCADLLARAAALLGRAADAERYTALAGRVRAAFRRRFVTPDGLLAAQTQTACVLALHFDLVEAHHRAGVAEALVRDIAERGWQLSTGFVGTPHLLDVLTDAGRLDAAYRLLLQRSWPSWLYAVTHGATTVWERWDGWTEERGFQDPAMNSFNHYAYGAVGAWLYQTVAGINLDSEAPAYRRAVLRPRPGGGLTWARGALRTRYGELVSDWRLDGGSFEWRVVVPPNTSARLWFPPGAGAPLEGGRPARQAEGVRAPADGGGAALEVAAGSYRFSAPLDS